MRNGVRVGATQQERVAVGISTGDRLRADRPPAPGMFSMMTVCPSWTDSIRPASRATRSVGPPAGKDTTILMNRSG
jgi:hypothetical protein